MRIGVYRVSDNFFITNYPVTGFDMAVFAANCLYGRNLILDDDRFDVVAKRLQDFPYHAAAAPCRL